jgi:hypothetical protein
MTIETTRAEPPLDLEGKVPDEAVNVLGQATKALKKLAKRQNDRPAAD